jgi:hypothetical protein
MSNFVIDKTLRLLYRTALLRGGGLMAIRFLHRGQQYEVDTVEEAIRLRRVLEKEDAEDVQIGNITEEELSYDKTKWSEDRFLALTQNIGIAQQKFLAALITAPRGPVHVKNIAKRLQLSSTVVLAGIQSGLAKQLRAIGLEPIDLYRVEISWIDGERNRYLTLNEGFRLASLDNGWPPDYVSKGLKALKK